MSVRDYSVGAISAILGALLLFGSMPYWWFGVGLIAGGIAVVVWTAREEIGEALEWFRQPREVWGVEVVPADALAELFFIFVIAALTAAMMPYVTLGDPPTNHDHTVHFFKAWQLQQEFLAEGHIYGWSHRWFAGYPAQYLYPIGADMLVVAIHTLTFGIADLSTAYAWAIWFFWFAGGYAVYRLGASAFGRWGALLAAVLFMTDTAAARIGGWHFAMKWGVWPMSMATVFSVWAVARLPRVLERDQWGDLAIYAILVMAALITHPFMLIHLTLALIVALFAYWIADTERHWLVGAVRLGAGTAVGVLMACIWLVPFLSAKDFMDPHFGGTWTTMLAIGRGFYQLDFLPGTWSMAIAFGVVGMFALLWSRKFENLLIGMLSVMFIVFGSTDFLAGFNFLEIFSSFQRVHFKRFITLLKPYFLLTAAYGVVCVVRFTFEHAVRLLRDESREEASGWETLQPMAKRWMRFVVVFLCLAPLALPFLDAFGANHVERGLKTASERPHQRARREAARWFREKYPDGEPFFRVAMDLFRHDHRFVDFGRRIPFPVYKIGYTPATSYVYRFETKDEVALKALNVRYVLSLGAPPSGEFEKVESFGGLNLYEYDHWQKDPFEVIEGSGPVELQKWSDEEIVLRAGEGAEGRLRLNVSYFDRWRAYRDGEAVEISETELDFGTRNGFMTVDLAPGTYRFVFERGLAERAAFVLFFLGLLLAIALFVADSENRYGSMLRRGLERVQSAIVEFTRSRRVALDTVGAAGAALLVVVGAGMAWVWPPLRVKGRDFGEDIEEVHYDFGDQLRHASVGVKTGKKSIDPCQPLAGYFMCGRAAWKVVHQRVDDFGPELSMARCIWAHPVPKGPIEIHYDDVPAGEAIVGYYGVPESGTTSKRNPAKLKVGYDGVYHHTGEARKNKELYTFEVPVAREKRGRTVDISFQISARNTGQRHFCFNAQMVDVRGEPEAHGEPSSDDEASK